MTGQAGKLQAPPPRAQALCLQPCTQRKRVLPSGNRSCRSIHRLSRLQATASGSARFDADDESGPAAPELDVKKETERLALLWKLQTSRLRKPEPCNCCQGSGERECRWCHGTGVMMLGDSLVCSTSEHHCKCPVCNAQGYSPCTSCRGTGYRAKWLGGNTTCEV